MRLLTAALLGCTVLVSGIAQAQGFRVGNAPAFRTTVTPLPDGIYEVSASGTSAAVAYWCGIGDFAIRTLRTKATQRIYITEAYERQIRTVKFALTPPPGVDTTPGYSVTVKRVGENMTAAAAQGYCYDNFLDFGF